MQFDQRMIVRFVLAATVIVAGLVQWLNSGPQTHVPPSVPLPTTTAAPAAPATADDERSPVEARREAPASGLPVSQGDFDYYVLVLSWSPTHCSSNAGRGRDDDMQCRSGRPYGFVLHGLWPQNERGYPQACDTDQPHEVTAENMARALKISPSKDLVQHEWEKHGTCSGLSQDDFFVSEIAAYASVKVPSADKLPVEPMRTTPDEVREAFLKENPALMPENVSATCSRNELAEIWLCLDKSLQPRACSAEVRKRHCGARHVRMRAVRGDWP